jgi:hypothetical protein
MLFSGAYVLWPDPLVVGVMEQVQLQRVLAMRAPAHVFYSPTWLWTPRSVPNLLRWRWIASRRGKSLHFLTCAASEDRLLRSLGFPGDLVSISCYLNDHLFRITGEPKLFDAVYAASMYPYKRMHLAGGVKSLLIQTYGDRKTASGEHDLAGFEPAVAHAAYNKGWVSAAEVVSRYNSARVGLSLSACEGAMLASVEYMLCGLPQVSTPSRGGREQFFDDRFVTIAEPTADAVARAVEAMIAREIDPDLIRRATLEKLSAHRQRLCRYVVTAVRQAGGRPPSEEQVRERLFSPPQGTVAHFVHHSNYADSGLV